MSSLSFAVLLVLPEFVHAFGTVGTNEPWVPLQARRAGLVDAN